MIAASPLHAQGARLIGLKVLDATGAGFSGDVIAAIDFATVNKAALVERIADQQVRNGRVAFRGLTLLGKPGEAWLHLRPDVYSIANTTVEDYVEPVIHEIKVKRADLKADLKKVDAFKTWLEQQPETTHVSSFVDVVKRLNRNLHGGDPAYYRIPDERDLIARDERVLYQVKVLGERLRRAPRRSQPSATCSWCDPARRSPRTG